MKKRIKNDDLIKTIKFLVKLAILSLPLYLILILNISLLPLQEAVAQNSLWLIESSGFTVEKTGLIMVCGTENLFSFYIGSDCTGWKSMMLLTALILATSAVTIKRRILGIVIGIPLIYAFNLLRILLVVIIENFLGREAAMFIHDWLWQLGLLIAVLVIWLIWLKWDKVFKWLEKLRKHIIALREK